MLTRIIFHLKETWQVMWATRAFHTCLGFILFAKGSFFIGTYFGAEWSAQQLQNMDYNVPLTFVAVFTIIYLSWLPCSSEKRQAEIKEWVN